MYRPSSHVSRTKSFLPSPAPDELMDSDYAISTILEEKRREIETEIEVFKVQKEREFATFEDELRSRKRRITNNDLDHPTSRTSGVSILSNKDLQAHGSTMKDKKQKKKKKADHMNTGRSKPILGPSKPSVSIDRVTINGMTTPPVSGTPPLANILSRSPTYLSGTPPRSASEKESGKSPAVADKGDHFDGLFTPNHLQLLDTKPSSLPQDPTSQSLKPSKRSLTVPSLPSHSLPSALRSASGTIRKRKHVTFRLAHSVVVDPSSSYEETPSPSEDQDEEDFDDLELTSNTETLSASFPIEPTKSVPNGSLASPTKDGNDASFFSFDEELESPGMDSSNYQDEHDDGQAGPTHKDQSLEPVSPSFASGSLPIDIINPTLSFRAAMSG